MITQKAQPICTDLNLDCQITYIIVNDESNLGYAIPELDIYGDNSVVGYTVAISADCTDIDRALAHELRHVWQMETGLYSPYTCGAVLGIWQGKPVTQSTYSDLPWEVDAREYANEYISTH